MTECDNCGADCNFISNEARKLNIAGKPVDDVTIGESDYVQVVQGFCLDLSGHYGGFTDFYLGGGNLRRAVLCHDCCVAVARALPGLFKPNTGHHSMFYDVGDNSCCEFSWRFDPETGDSMVGDGKGGWIAFEN